jgi:hypothetical protein
MGATQAEDDSGLNIVVTNPPPDANWKPWILVDLGSEFHFVPSQDKIPHINSPNCDCLPSHKCNIKDIRGKIYPYYKHNSFDLREFDELWYVLQHQSQDTSLETERL